MLYKWVLSFRAIFSFQPGPGHKSDPEFPAGHTGARPAVLAAGNEAAPDCGLAASASCQNVTTTKPGRYLGGQKMTLLPLSVIPKCPICPYLSLSCSYLSLRHPTPPYENNFLISNSQSSLPGPYLLTLSVWPYLCPPICTYLDPTISVRHGLTALS